MLLTTNFYGTLKLDAGCLSSVQFTSSAAIKTAGGIPFPQLQACSPGYCRLAAQGTVGVWWLARNCNCRTQHCNLCCNLGSLWQGPQLVAVAAGVRKQLGCAAWLVSSSLHCKIAGFALWIMGQDLKGTVPQSFRSTYAAAITDAFKEVVVFKELTRRWSWLWWRQKFPLQSKAQPCTEEESQWPEHWLN